jgi:hypothetical protein
MTWSAVISSLDVVAIHSALLSTANGDGEILLFGGDDHDRQANIDMQWDHARRFSCRHPTQALVYVQSPDADLFCCGHGFLGDGRLLTGGGTVTFPPQSEGIHAHLHFEGHRRCFIYDPSSPAAFTEAGSMNFEPAPAGALPHGGGRWYPTLLTLASGEVLAVAGHPSGDDDRHNNSCPERYQPITASWILLAEVADNEANPDVYPRLHLLRDGSVFVSSALSGNGTCISIDPGTGQKTTACDLPDPAYRGFDRPSVLLPLTPNDGYTNRVLLCGGVTSQFKSLSDGTPGWTAVPRNGATATLNRMHASATLLPTGDVLMTGGTDPNSTADDQTGVMQPELYATPIDHAAGTPAYGAGPGTWTTLNDPATVLRNYHSSALLMPDGRVWTAGGNSPTQPDTPPSDAQKKIEIFDPPYPAGSRPQITAAPRLVAYRDQFIVETPQAAQIRSITLLRCGTSTHAFNPDQRCIFLAFAHETGNRLRVTAPPDGGVAPPGNYMLFLIDEGGRPCQYASFVRVGGAMSLFTDRTTFSQHEVQGLLSGPQPWIDDAVFVVLDGFTAGDLAGSSDRPWPLTLGFAFADDGTTVPGWAATLSSTNLESNSAPASAAQRIALGYRITFNDDHAFDNIANGAGRDIVVTARWGVTQATGRLSVYRHEHVYELDGSVPWLSIDVQVLQLGRGDTFAGLPPDDDPAAFIAAALQTMRTTADDANHPFERLRNQPAQTLELADSVNGQLRDNFAFAKVRFRAPSGVNASNVKVLFRMFTTAATNLAYSPAVYPRLGDGATAIALPGIVNGEVVSQPFYAGARSPDPTTQQDTANRADLHGAGAPEVVGFFGAWLDFNHDTTIRNRIRGQHQCMVAEVHYVPSPIAPGATPAGSDQLAQRNLAIVESDNPGDAAAHTVAHTFDLKPSSGGLLPTAMVGQNTGQATNRAVAARALPDELFLRWHDLPRDSIVQLYLPDADVHAMLAYASRRSGAGTLAAIDDHTIACRIGDATFLPLPGGRSSNIAGLLTIQLPPSVRTGQSYRVVAHQVSGISHSIVASFQLTIPVSTASAMLPVAQRSFDVLSEIGATIAPGDRWRPVFDRYLQVLGSRLISLGGTTGHPRPSPYRVRGKVREIVYDCFGDFEGFVLDACGILHAFKSRDHRIWRLVEEAAHQRLLVTVEPCAHDAHSIEKVALRFD